MIRSFVIILLLGCVFCFSACSLVGRRDDKLGAVTPATRDPSVDRRLVRVGLELLDVKNSRYDPEKGKAYLEFALKHGFVKLVEIPAPVLLEILKSEKVATERSRNLEQQLEIMKEIDLNRQETL